jgi:hypothetical protein
LNTAVSSHPQVDEYGYERKVGSVTARDQAGDKPLFPYETVLLVGKEVSQAVAKQK